MRESELIDLSDLNLAESHREFARFHPDGLILEAEGLLLTRGAREHPGLNFAMRIGPRSLSPDEVIRRASAFFSDSCRGFAIRTRLHADEALISVLKRNHRYPGGETVGMYRVGTLPQDPIPKGVHLHPVDNLERAHHFTDVASSAFTSEGLHELVSRAAFTRLERLVGPHLRGFVAYQGDRPASVALALLCGGAAGIYWVGTARGHRRRGLARLVVRAAHNWACDRGARSITLQCSPKHVPLYARFGYHELTRYPWFMLLKDPARS